MTPQDALAELLARVGASGGDAVFTEAQELAAWPAAAVMTMKAQKLLVRARPAASVVCPGCERACVMPVHVIPAQGTASRTFVICDKRSDINRVNIPVGHLEQWQASGEATADFIARALDLRRPSGSASSAGRWELGMFKGAKHSAHLVLLADGNLKLSLAGHSIALVDALGWKGDAIVIDRRMLVRCADAPAAGAGDAESAAQRRARLRARVREVKAKGTKAFLKVVAGEEGVSESRLKQLVRETATPAESWSGLARESKGAVSKREKAKR